MDLYSIVKSLHVISVIAWMAGLLYLPRLYVYHCDVTPGSEADEKFKVMERRLLRAIMNPAMIATWIFGGYLISASGAMCGSDDHCPYDAGKISSGLCRRCQYQISKILSGFQRSPDNPHDHHCFHGDRKAVLIL
jgi:uncharacterized membrane protein